jgi:hypothetical protein
MGLSTVKYAAMKSEIGFAQVELGRNGSFQEKIIKLITADRVE